MIHAASISKEYNDFRALDDVSFDMDGAGILGVVGHNGAGKTTLLKIMSGLIPLTSGELVINGIDAVNNPDELKQSLGYLPEESRVYENMTPEAYLMFFGEIYGMSSGEISAKTAELFKALDLNPGEKKLGELSKGMKRKAAIARSLLHDPSYLVYDEPASGLDPMTSRYISDFLRSLKAEKKKTIVLSAHNLYQVEEICDRVMILQRGKRIAFGTMDELREQFGDVYYEVEFVMDDLNAVSGLLESYNISGGIVSTRVPDIDALNNLTASVSEAGGRVKKIESHYPSLEEMLMKIGQ